MTLVFPFTIYSSENGEKGEVVDEAPAPAEPEEPEVIAAPKKKAPSKEKKSETSEGGFEFWNELEIQRIKFLVSDDLQH